jgi:hypothetical protein
MKPACTNFLTLLSHKKTIYRMYDRLFLLVLSFSHSVTVSQFLFYEIISLMLNAFSLSVQFPTKEFPYHNLGFCLVEFTDCTRPSPVYKVSVALYGYSQLSESVLPSSREFTLAPPCDGHERTAVSGCGSLDFPLQRKRCSDLS